VYTAYPLINDAYYFYKAIYPVIFIKVLSGFVLSIPYVFLGATIPALVTSDKNIANTSGDLLFLSGIANAIGLIVFTFILFPSLRIFTIIPVCIGIIMISFAIHTMIFPKGS